MTAATGRLLAYATLALGALVAFVTGAQPWWNAVVAEGRGPVSGNLSSGSLTQALAVVTVAGVLLSLTLAARGRQVLGAVLALAGSGMVWVGAARPRPSQDVVQQALRSFSLSVDGTLEATPWPWAYAAGGVLVAVGGVLLVVLAPRWGSRRSRFERGPVAVDLEDPTAIWKALDAGVDPTDQSAIASPEQVEKQDRKSQR
ncbi:trp region conserved hypothetical membrane protein [Raineyella antarctica]|uniref:Trp region conserved hypothetical membrane protein n=1 Tax=Raineyella antarctica TaxID=1577474 RepID=A0A1G6GTN8_9ACTN|nr:Trp biosynthesis-associated membrane protein [Raineyella antarctica]SDB85314.1 trp region conserved hypothetical membrane protein [Raineyella antarctica]